MLFWSGPPFNRRLKFKVPNLLWRKFYWWWHKRVPFIRHNRHSI